MGWGLSKVARSLAPSILEGEKTVGSLGDDSSSAFVSTTTSLSSSSTLSSSSSSSAVIGASPSCPNSEVPSEHRDHQDEQQEDQLNEHQKEHQQEHEEEEQRRRQKSIHGQEEEEEEDPPRRNHLGRKWGVSFKLRGLPESDKDVSIQWPEQPELEKRGSHPRRLAGQSFGRYIRLWGRARAAAVPRPLGLSQGSRSTASGGERKRKRKRWESRLSDDDSDDEVVNKAKPFIRHLRTTKAEKIQQLSSWTSSGIDMHFDELPVDQLRPNLRRLDVSRMVALHFAADVRPSSCRTLQSGKIRKLTSAARPFSLQRSSAGWWLCVGQAVFNFTLRRWQPRGLARAYSAVRGTLYVAFAPQANVGKRQLFVKLGYRELSKDQVGDNSLIGYVEQKSSRLKITNVAGAGIFVFPPPADHEAFERPAKAAEASLKTEMLHCSELVVLHSGNRADIGSFSTSLEYMFIEDACSQAQDPIRALRTVLRRFSGNPSLEPLRAEAPLCAAKRGRKRLRSWPAQAQQDEKQQRQDQQNQGQGQSQSNSRREGQQVGRVMEFEGASAVSAALAELEAQSAAAAVEEEAATSLPSQAPPATAPSPAHRCVRAATSPCLGAPRSRTKMGQKMVRAPRARNSW